jgi:chemotaxis-related protein WspB
VFAYRGMVIPVVDLCRMLLGTNCQSRLSSRIVVVEPGPAKDVARYGILAERVTGVRRLSGSSGAPLAAPGTRYVSSTVLEDGRLIQLLDLNQLLPREAALAAT